MAGQVLSIGFFVELVGAYTLSQQRSCGFEQIPTPAVAQGYIHLKSHVICAFRLGFSHPALDVGAEAATVADEAQASILLLQFLAFFGDGFAK